MEILWLAIVFYSIGLGLVLHFKPRLMFNENGTWKEFGYQAGPRHTLFPVWLFAITWAVASYAIASVIRWTYLGPVSAIASSSAVMSMMPSGRVRTAFGRYDDMEAETEAEEEEEEEESESLGQRVSETIRIPRGHTVRPQTPARKPRSGYYVLDPQSKSGDGLRKYIYYGDAPPPEIGGRGVSV
jgi:hypothetical protein